MRISLLRRVSRAIALLGTLTSASASVLAQTSLIEQGRAALGRGETDSAVGILEKAVAQSPQSAEAHFALGSAYGNKAQASGMFGAPRYASKLKGEFEKAGALDPKYIEPRFGLVQFYASAPGIMGGSHEKALAQAKDLKAINPLAGHRAYAFIYTQQKKLDLAEKEYLEALREEPASPKAHSYFGQYLANSAKNYAAAFAEFESALKLDPQYMPAFYHLGRTASLANTNLARGEEALKQYVAYTPKESEPALANAQYFLGDVYEKQGRKAEARQAYMAALKLNPSLVKAGDALKRVS